MADTRSRPSLLARCLAIAVVGPLSALADAGARGQAPAVVDGVYVAGPLECIRASRVQVSVVMGENNTLRALFGFAMAAEPTRMYSYSLRGIYDPSKKTLRLKPDKWEVLYAGYSLAGIEVRFDPGGGRGAGELKGKIDYAGCRGLKVERDRNVTMPSSLAAFARSPVGATPSGVAVSAVGPPGGTPTASAAVDRRLPSIDSVKGDAQCALLVRWLGRFPEEEKIGPLDHGGRPLFWDEEFVPLFGQPYDMATPKWRADVYDRVIRKCLTNSHASTVDIGRPLRTYAEQVGLFQEMLEGALVRPGRVINPPSVIMTLTQGRRTRDWMATTLAKYAAAPATLASITELRQQLQPIDRDPHYFFFTQHRGLWPSEQLAFAKALRTRLSTLSGSVAGGWLADLKRTVPSVASVQRTSTEIQQYADFLAELAPPQREEIVTATFAAFNAIVDGALAPALDGLRQAPSNLNGAIRTTDTATTLEGNVAKLYLNKPIDYRDAPEAKLIRARFIDVQTAARARIMRVVTDERARIIGGARPEWQAQLASAGRSLQALQIPARTLRQMFVDGERERGDHAALETELLRAVGLDLSGFEHPDLFASLYLGRFRLLTTNSYLDANSARRYALEGYVVKFSQRCEAYLPRPRAEIMRVETEELIEKRGGWEISRTELRREVTSTGIFAAPEFAAVYVRPTPADRLSGIGQILVAFLGKPNPGDMIRTAAKMIETSLAVRVDVGRFLDRYDCDSAVTRRFAENVLRASDGRPPVDPVLD